MEPGSSREHFPAIWQLIEEHITDDITDTTTYNYWSDVMSILVSHLFVILWSYFAMPQNPLMFYGKFGTTRISTNFVGVDWAWRLGTMMLQFGRLGKLSCHKCWLYITVQFWTLEIFHIFTGGDRNQRSASARGCLFRGREEDKEECRADSQLCTFVQDMYRLLQFGSV